MIAACNPNLKFKYISANRTFYSTPPYLQDPIGLEEGRAMWGDDVGHRELQVAAGRRGGGGGGPVGAACGRGVAP